jgi:hypothetical protein
LTEKKREQQKETGQPLNEPPKETGKTFNELPSMIPAQNTTVSIVERAEATYKKVREDMGKLEEALVMRQSEIDKGLLDIERRVEVFRKEYLALQDKKGEVELHLDEVQRMLKRGDEVTPK